MDELTEEHFQIAEKNGISRKNVRQRYWDYGWEIEKIISTPILKRDSSEWYHWKATCQQNGISSTLYCNRIKKGMTPEQAATTPVKKYKKGETHGTLPKA